MTDFESRLVAELSAEFRRTQPPPAMLAAAHYEPCMAHVIRPDRREGFRILWKRKASAAPFQQPIQWHGHTITLLFLL
jgi:hypothetical protein